MYLFEFTNFCSTKQEQFIHDYIDMSLKTGKLYICPYKLYNPVEFKTHNIYHLIKNNFLLVQKRNSTLKTFYRGKYIL